ncbi:MAG: hypothetical protein ABR552_08720 [Actinomycetota bacterium]|nr:hypothetical protein [Actinomycetota bacterium]
MALTYGEEMLARAEARARARRGARSARKRRRTLLFPASLATAWATVDTLVGQHSRAATALDGLELLAWTVVLVLIPLAVSIRPRRPIPAGAVVAVIAGPLLSPVLFGAGWSLWQSALVILVCAVVVLGARARRSR